MAARSHRSYRSYRSQGPRRRGALKHATLTSIFAVLPFALGACASDDDSQPATPAPLRQAQVAMSSGPAGGETPAPLATVRADQVLVRITRLNGGLARPSADGTETRAFREPILVMRGDGIALWSEDPKGAGPLLTGKVDPAAIETWANKVYAAGLLTDPAMRSHVGPDATSIELDIKIADQHLKISSWHEMVDPAQTIALEAGIVGLDGRDPAELMAKESAEYRRFVGNWKDLRAGLDDLLPQGGTPLPRGADLSRFE